jgi:hypothetical protein
LIKDDIIHNTTVIFTQSEAVIKTISLTIQDSLYLTFCGWT